MKKTILILIGLIFISLASAIWFSNSYEWGDDFEDGTINATFWTTYTDYRDDGGGGSVSLTEIADGDGSLKGVVIAGGPLSYTGIVVARTNTDYNNGYGYKIDYVLNVTRGNNVGIEISNGTVLNEDQRFALDYPGTVSIYNHPNSVAKANYSLLISSNGNTTLYNETGIVTSKNINNPNMTKWYVQFRVGQATSGTSILQLFNFTSGYAVKLHSPPYNGSSIDNTINFNCSAEDDTQLNNISLIIDGVVNHTVTGSSSFLELYKQLNMNSGSHTWSCNATDSSNNVINSPTRTLNLGLIENSQTYNPTSTVGGIETFSINITYNSSVISNIQGTLYYNNTAYSGTKSGTGNNVLFQTNLTIPSVTAQTNMSFYWEFISNPGTLNAYTNSTKNSQIINAIQIGNCTTYNHILYNYTLYDEETQSKLSNVTIDIQLRVYDLSRTIDVVNFSQSYSTNPAQVCTNSSTFSNLNYSIDSTVKYTSNDTTTNKSYVSEQYNILNGLLSNSSVPNNIKLYGLNSQDSTEFQLTVRDSSYSLASNVLIYLYRQYISENNFKIVEAPLTDNNGQTILHMVRNDVVYNIVVINANGEVLDSFNNMIAFCQDYTIGSCTINLNARGDADSIYNYEESLGISYTKPSYSNSTGLVSFSFVTDDLTSKTVQIEVIRNNQFGNRSVCSNSLTSTTGILTCDVSSVRTTDRFLFVNIYVEGDLLVTTTIDLEEESSGFGTVNGAFFAFMIILFIVIIFSEDKQVLVLSILAGWAIIISFGLVSGKLFGSRTIISSGIWLITSAIILLWKLQKEDNR